MKTNKLNVMKCTTWLVLGAMLAPYASAAAQPSQRDAIKAEISAEFEKRYEQPTPGADRPSWADQVLDFSGKAVKDNVIDMLTDFKMGVVNGYNLAANGNGTIVVIGAKNGWKLFKEYGEAAGIHYVDSIYLLPKKAVEIGKGFAKAGKNIADIAVKEGQNTADAWKDSAHDIKRDAEEFKDTAEVMNDLARAGYEGSYHTMVNGIKDGASNAANWSKDVYEWTKDATKDAFVDLTQGTVNNIEGTGRWTKATAKFWVDATVDSARSVNRWSEATWDFTVDATKFMWDATKNGGKAVGQGTLDDTKAAGKWLANNATTPFRQGTTAISDYSKWNWKHGYTEGLKEGFSSAANAWDHDDKLMATLWTMAGVGKGALHILILEPTVVPLLATYGVAGTVGLSTLGYPSVGAFFLGGMAASGATYATGTALTGAVAVGGTAATLVAGGGGIIRTGATAAIGTVATASVIVGGATYTAGAAGVNALRTVATPLVGAVGAAGALAAGGLEIAGSTVLGTAEATGVTALTAGGYTLLTGYEATKMTYAAVRAAGITVFDNAIVTPVGVVTNLVQAVATGAWTLAEDPVYGTLDVLAAGGIAVGTIATSTGAFSYELVKGILTGLVHGVEAVGASGIWVVGAVAKAAEFVYTALDIPLHHDWAAFRREEVAEVFEQIKKEADASISSRFGDIILIRVHWWGEDKGRVRFFITKDKKTGERWFFKRVIDGDTCEVKYKITNQDPVVRAFTQKAWAGVYASGLYNQACEQAKAGAQGK